jgi:hypothetical protein
MRFLIFVIPWLVIFLFLTKLPTSFTGGTCDIYNYNSEKIVESHNYRFQINSECTLQSKLGITGEIASFKIDYYLLGDDKTMEIIIRLPEIDLLLKNYFTGELSIFFKKGGQKNLPVKLKINLTEFAVRIPAVERKGFNYYVFLETDESTVRGYKSIKIN